MPDGSALKGESELDGWRARLLRAIKGRSLYDCLEGRRDNIALLRLLAAVFVVLGHCGLGGQSQVPYDFIHILLPSTYLHVIGVMMFFTVSGFLITHSYDRRPDLARFVRARFLRLWPALVVCAVGVAFVLGPLLTSLPLGEYFSPGRANSPYAYVLGSMSLFDTQLRISGLFSENRISSLANGPLWTIPVEATMYVWVAGAGALRLLRFPWLTSFAIAAVFSVLLLWPMMTGPFVTLNTKLSVQGFFGAGAIAYLLRRHIPISTALMIAIAAACFFARHTIHAIPFIWLAVVYFVFWFSYVPRLPAMPHDVDLSYGIYLWGWPIQQTLVQVAHVRDPLVMFAATLAIAAPIALASWLLVEKPALGLKDFTLRFPRALKPA